MKLTEEEYTDLVQKRLEYKLTFDDYCKLKKDDRIITQLILLSFEMEYTSDEHVKMQVKRKKNEYDFYNNLIQEFREFIEYISLPGLKDSYQYELNIFINKFDLLGLVPLNSKIKDLKQLLKNLENQLEISLPNLVGHSSRNRVKFSLF